MIIYVKTIIGRKSEIEVEPSDSIEKIKEKIKEREGYPPDKQILLFNGRNLEDGKTLADYNIQKESTINMFMKIRGHDPKTIYIMHKGKKREIKICLCRHVEYLKEYIQKELGIKPECQELRLNGKILKEGKDILSLGVKEYSIIDLNIIPDELEKIEGIYDFMDNDEILNYKEKYKNELAQLNDMGYYDEEINIQILKQCSGNVQYAIEKLVNIMG